MSGEGRKSAEMFRERFLKAGAHDLRAPLAVIKESLNLMLEGVAGGLNDRQRDILSTARNNVDKAAAMIDGLMEAAAEKEAGDGRE